MRREVQRRLPTKRTGELNPEQSIQWTRTRKALQMGKIWHADAEISYLGNTNQNLCTQNKNEDFLSSHLEILYALGYFLCSILSCFHHLEEPEHLLEMNGFHKYSSKHLWSHLMNTVNDRDRKH